MKIIAAQEEHIPVIREIAYKTWPEAYLNILTEEQSEYMLDWMYSASALKEQMLQLEHRFLLAKEEDSAVFQGYVSYELHYKERPETKIHKLYVLPEYHGRSIGRILIDKVAEEAKKNNDTAILLNMNRMNKALNFYTHLGFRIIGEENIDIGKGFLMEDYIFKKDLYL
ncbi:GNAT family N-acetyltransferase [Parabacteroides sp. Marseille-P3160]|uniref:GNAT family N-acetyltransferase n=1 Tax=Parabacteroides sp. Marseille-P3160 TaxID=1917887 RepID=UPI0009BA0B10|nr:GNAT family N-acetyltransferase [Parabacteroides sp. Marseille-P3160]